MGITPSLPTTPSLPSLPASCSCAKSNARWCAVPLVRGAMDGRAHRERRHALLVRVREADLRARLRRRRRASAPRANRRERAQRLRQRAALRGFTS